MLAGVVGVMVVGVVVLGWILRGTDKKKKAT
jgi:hypothetical protein